MKLKGLDFTQKSKSASSLSPEARKEFNRELESELADLEAFRLEKLEVVNQQNELIKKYAKSAVVPLIVLELGLQIFSSSYSLLSGHGVPFFICAGAAIFIWKMKPYNLYHQQYKEKVLPILLRSLGDFSYQIDGSLDVATLESFKIYPKHQHRKSEDYFKGAIQDIGLEFCELHLENSGDKSRVTVFQGAAILLEMPFTFLTHTVVSKNKERKAFSNFRNSNLQTIELEDLDFEEKFTARTLDPLAARYLLSPAMMKRLMELEEKYNTLGFGAQLRCEFKDNKALFLISYIGNFFESPKLTVSAYDNDNLVLIQDQLRLIVSVIEQLKLDYLVARKLAYKTFDLTSE